MQLAQHCIPLHLQRHGGAALSAGVNLMLAERTTTAAQVDPWFQPLLQRFPYMHI